jgi:hypothetical protein
MLDRQDISGSTVYKIMDLGTDNYKDEEQETECDKTGMQQREELYVSASKLATVTEVRQLYCQIPLLFTTM